jgi:GTP-binding protein
MYKTMDLLEKTKRFDLYDDEDYDEVVEYTFEPDEDVFSIKRGDDGVFDVTGKSLKKIFDMTDFTKDQSVKRFSRILRSLGIDARLRDNGVKNGDTVRIHNYEFEFLD